MKSKITIYREIEVGFDDETGNFEFKIKKNRNRVGDTLIGIKEKIDFYLDFEIEKKKIKPINALKQVRHYDNTEYDNTEYEKVIITSFALNRYKEVIARITLVKKNHRSKAFEYYAIGKLILDTEANNKKIKEMAELKKQMGKLEERLTGIDKPSTEGLTKLPNF